MSYWDSAKRVWHPEVLAYDQSITGAAYRIAVLSVPSATVTTVPMDTFASTGGSLAPVTSSGDVKVKAAGSYRIVGNVGLVLSTSDANITKIFEASIYINGVLAQTTRGPASVNPVISVYDLAYLSVDDVISLRVLHDTAGNKNTSTLLGAYPALLVEQCFCCPPCREAPEG